MEPRSATLTIGLETQELDHVIEAVLAGGLPFVQPKSMELNIPGRSTWVKLARSVDGGKSYDHTDNDHLRTAVLPFESEFGMTGLTTLSNPTEFLTLPRDSSDVAHCLRQCLSDARITANSGRSSDPWVRWTFWGMTRICYISDAGDLRSGWFLRAKVGGLLTPIIRVSCGFRNAGYRERVWLNIRLYGWAWHAPQGSAVRELHAPEAVHRMNEANADLLSAGIAFFLSTIPGTRYCWEIDPERMDQAGSLPRKLEYLLGRAEEVRALGWGR